MALYVRLAVLFGLVLFGHAVQYCYKIKALSYRTTETPKYRFSMTLLPNSTVSSTSMVLEDIPIPMWHWLLVHKPKNRLRILYNGTVKLCEFSRFVKRVKAFNDIANSFLRPESGNMTLSCPLRKGKYVLHNVHVPPDAGILKFIYVPNSIYTLYGTVLSQLPDKRVAKLCTYEINGTITKQC